MSRGSCTKHSVVLVEFLMTHGFLWAAAALWRWNCAKQSVAQFSIPWQNILELWNILALHWRFSHREARLRALNLQLEPLMVCLCLLLGSRVCGWCKKKFNFLVNAAAWCWDQSLLAHVDLALTSLRPHSNRRSAFDVDVLTRNSLPIGSIWAQSK